MAPAPRVLLMPLLLLGTLAGAQPAEDSAARLQQLRARMAAQEARGRDVSGLRAMLDAMERSAAGPGGAAPGAPARLPENLNFGGTRQADGSLQGGITMPVMRPDLAPQVPRNADAQSAMQNLRQMVGQPEQGGPYTQGLFMMRHQVAALRSYGKQVDGLAGQVEALAPSAQEMDQLAAQKQQYKDRGQRVPQPVQQHFRTKEREHKRQVKAVAEQLKQEMRAVRESTQDGRNPNTETLGEFLHRSVPPQASSGDVHGGH